MPRNALVIGAGAGLLLLIDGVYGMSSLYTLSWGVPLFIVGLFLTIICSIAFIEFLQRGDPGL